MGIPFFYSAFLRNRGYRGVLLKELPQYVSSLNIDMNGIIHACAQLIYAYGEGEDPVREQYVLATDPKTLENELRETIFQMIFNLVTAVQPREVLTIAIDGTAPMAKIQQQRQRRYRAALESRSGRVFDSNAITPGTDFMQRLDKYLRQRLIENQYVLPPKIIYSSHLVSGEGEHKIIDLMRSGEITGEGAHVLYGLDADLIMLSMVAPLNNIFLMREDISDVVHIDNLKTAIIEELGSSSTAVHDFVFMMYLVGNDFLPHMPALADMIPGIDAMFMAYKQAQRSLTKIDPVNGSYQIDWAGLVEFLKALSREEPVLLEKLAGKENKYPSRMLRMGTTIIQQPEGPNLVQLNMETYRNAWYNNALEPKGDTNILALLNEGQPPFPISTDRITDMIYNYLTGLAWVFSYYTNGMKTINLNYNYKYHHTPLIEDLTTILGALVEQNLINDVIAEYPAVEGEFSFNPVHQLLAVLPPRSKNLIPIEVRFLLNPDSPIADMFPEDFIIERDGTNHDWQGISILPPVEPARIIAAVAEVIWDPYRANQYAWAENVIITKNLEVEKLLQDKERTLQKIAQITEAKRREYLRGRGTPRGPRVSMERGVPGAQRGRGVPGAPMERGVPGAQRGRGVPGAPMERGVPGAPMERGVPGAQRGRGGSRGRGGQRGRGGPRDNLNIPVRPNVPPEAPGPGFVPTSREIEIPPLPPTFRSPGYDPLPRPGQDQPHLYSRNGRGGNWRGTRGGLGSGRRPPTQEVFAVPPPPEPTPVPAVTKQETWRSKTFLM